MKKDCKFLGFATTIDAISPRKSILRFLLEVPLWCNLNFFRGANESPRPNGTGYLDQSKSFAL